MFCPKCGTKLEESAQFCTNCGTNISHLNSPKPQQNPPIQRTAAYQSLADYTFAEVKQFAKTPLVIAAIVTFTLGILNLSSPGSSIGMLITLLADTLDIPIAKGIAFLLDQVLTEVSGVLLIFTTVISNLPDVLLALGMWLVLISAFKNSNVKLSPSGMTLIKVITTIQFVASLIAPVILVILMFYTLSDVLETEALLIFAGIFAAVIAMFVFYYKKLLQILNNIRYTMETGTPAVEISGFIIFCCFASGIVSVLTSPFSAAATILFGIILIKYKNKMIDIRDNGHRYITAETFSENP